MVHAEHLHAAHRQTKRAVLADVVRDTQLGQCEVERHSRDGVVDRVRKHLRRFRRTNWQGSQYGSAPLLVEDPVPRNSQHSYFIQLADLVAYAASRHAVPATGKTTRICDATMWDRMEPIQIKAINMRGDGIYKWP